MDWLDLAQDRYKWPALLYTVTSDTIKCVEYFDELRNYQLLQTSSAVCNYLISEKIVFITLNIDFIEIYMIPLICDKSVTTQNLAFFSYWYKKKRLQMHF